MQTRNRKKEKGRPKGTHKKFRFEETPLGFMLKYEVPVVYDIIMSMAPPDTMPEPPYLLIKIICDGSGDSSLKKDKFHRYLDQYARSGLCCKRAKTLTPERQDYYEAMRKKKLEKYIKENQSEIEYLRLIATNT